MSVLKKTVLKKISAYLKEHFKNDWHCVIKTCFSQSHVSLCGSSKQCWSISITWRKDGRDKQPSLSENNILNCHDNILKLQITLSWYCFVWDTNEVNPSKWHSIVFLLSFTYHFWSKKNHANFSQNIHLQEHWVVWWWFFKWKTIVH